MTIHFFFFNDTAATEIYTLSLHDALPICEREHRGPKTKPHRQAAEHRGRRPGDVARSEEHTSELQSQFHIVCRLLLEKKKKPLRNNYQPQQSDKKFVTYNKHYKSTPMEFE